MWLKHKFTEKIRCFYLVNFNYRYKSNMLRYKLSDNKKNKKQIKNEIFELKKYWGCFPLQYFNHDFYSNDCELTIDEMKSFIPSYYFYRIIFPQYDDSKSLLNIVEDKIVMDILFEGLGFPKANVIIKKKAHYLFNSNGVSIASDALLKEILNFSTNKLFIKPKNGRGGSGILIAKRDGDCFKVNNESFNTNFLKSLKGDYVIEEAIKQRDSITAVYPYSVNTLRIITKRNSDGLIEIVATTLRMGAKGSEIDNTSAGGLVIGIDFLTGCAFRDYATHEYGLERFYQHPDSGFLFKNLLIDDWLDIKFKIVELASKNIILNLTGWDVALIEKGIVIIEVNTLFGIDGLQSALGGLEHKFNENYLVRI